MEPLKFTVHSLLTEKHGDISGAMGPVLFANEMMGKLHLQYNRLARICFEEDEIFQNHEDHYLTAHDVLIIGQQFTNRLWLSLWIDEAVKGIPIAKGFSDEPVTVCSAYKNAEYTRKLTHAEIEQIFTYLFANPNELDITQ